MCKLFLERKPSANPKNIHVHFQYLNRGALIAFFLFFQYVWAILSGQYSCQSGRKGQRKQDTGREAHENLTKRNEIVLNETKARRILEATKDTQLSRRRFWML